MRKQMGRPIVPTSARQKTPWKAWGKSRAWYYWYKKWDALPPPPYPNWDAHDIGVEGYEYSF